MIARGDLAVEIGFLRLAEMQDEILWLCEAAAVPVVWSTQVLETLVETGVENRAEMTDAAYGAAAECVMLNKGPCLTRAVQTRAAIIERRQADQQKKTPMLRRLRS
jgi:pyruvate kinase